jgi:hypothetical protein
VRATGAHDDREQPGGEARGLGELREPSPSAALQALLHEVFRARLVDAHAGEEAQQALALGSREGIERRALAGASATHEVLGRAHPA